MSNIRPGQSFKTTVTASSNLFKATCNGIAVDVSITPKGGDQYELQVDGADITCPGPLKFFHYSGGMWVEIASYNVAPCP